MRDHRVDHVGQRRLIFDVLDHDAVFRPCDLDAGSARAPSVLPDHDDRDVLRSGPFGLQQRRAVIYAARLCAITHEQVDAAAVPAQEILVPAQVHRAAAGPLPHGRGHVRAVQAADGDVVFVTRAGADGHRLTDRREASLPEGDVLRALTAHAAVVHGKAAAQQRGQRRRIGRLVRARALRQAVAPAVHDGGFCGGYGPADFLRQLLPPDDAVFQLSDGFRRSIAAAPGQGQRLFLCDLRGRQIPQVQLRDGRRVGVGAGGVEGAQQRLDALPVRRRECAVQLQLPVRQRLGAVPGDLVHTVIDAGVNKSQAHVAARIARQLCNCGQRIAEVEVAIRRRDHVGHDSAGIVVRRYRGEDGLHGVGDLGHGIRRGHSVHGPAPARKSFRRRFSAVRFFLCVLRVSLSLTDRRKHTGNQ